MFYFICFIVTWPHVFHSLCGQRWPWAPDPSVSVSLVPELQSWATISGLCSAGGQTKGFTHARQALSQPSYTLVLRILFLKGFPGSCTSSCSQVGGGWSWMCTPAGNSKAARKPADWYRFSLVTTEKRSGEMKTTCGQEEPLDRVLKQWFSCRAQVSWGPFWGVPPSSVL